MDAKFEESLKTIKNDVKLISVLEKQYNVVANNSGNEDPTLYIGVAETSAIEGIIPEIEKFFGKPYIKAGESAMWANMFDYFVLGVGGCRPEQTLYRKEIMSGVNLYVAVWPWATKPEKTSIRIGLTCVHDKAEALYNKELKGYF